MEKEKISIIVPAYNIADYLGRCLDSLLAQTYQNLQIIVVDDGSTDNTGKVLDQYAAEDSRIIAVHQKNAGVSAARNHGLDLASGDYIGFADGDDFVEPDMFEILATLIKEKNVDIAHCGYQMVFPNRVDYYHNMGIKEQFDHDQGLYELLSGKKVEPGLWNKLYKRKLFDHIRLPEGIAETEDLMCNYDLFDQASSSFFIDIPKYHYMIRNGSATQIKLSEKKHRDRQYVTEYMYQKSVSNKEIRTVAYEKYIRILMENIQQEDYPKLKRDSKLLLKKNSKQIFHDSELNFKVKGMVFGTLYMSNLYKIVRKIHDVRNGNSHKYDVEEEH